MSAPLETIHATTIAIRRGPGWRAVLLAGRSGCGKSDLALRLIDRGAMLVADDYTDLHDDGGRLFATPPARIAGRLEVRGLGLIDLPHLDTAPVALLVTLDEAVERMPEPSSRRLAGFAVPVVALAALEASAPIKVERAFDLWGLA